MIMQGVLFAAAGYISGSLMFSKWLPALCGVDVTEASSDGNPGAFNAIRLAGAPLGLLCLLLDLLKGFVPVFIYRAVGGEGWLLAAVMFSPVVGHAWPALLHFRGGKAIAVTFGVLLGLAPDIRLAVLLAVLYLLSLPMPLRSNERRTVCAMAAFCIGAAFMVLSGYTALPEASAAWLAAAVVIFKNLDRRPCRTEQKEEA